MSRTFRKYEFPTADAAHAAVEALGVDEEGNPTHPHAIVHLGHIVTTPATMDEEGNELTPAILADHYSVDVLWQGEPVASWDGNMIWCAPMGVHTFGSSSAIAEWSQKCKELHPEFFPTPEQIEE
jgi:hypothetical protein